jgi:hypothetical protein
MSRRSCDNFGTVEEEGNDNKLIVFKQLNTKSFF